MNNSEPRLSHRVRGGTRALRPAASRRIEGGFTLIEVMVAITLLAIVLIGLAQMTYVLARRTRDASVVATRAAIATQELNRITALPYSQLAGEVGTVTVDQPPMPYKRTIALDESISPHQVTVEIAPLNTAYKSQTVVLRRMPVRSTPLNPTP